MMRRYGLLLLAMLLAPTAFAQQVDTVIIYRSGPPHLVMPRHIPHLLVPPMPPGAEMDEDFVLDGDSVHAYRRRLPETHRRLRLHADSIRWHADSLLHGGRFRLHVDSLRGKMRLLSPDATIRFFGRLDADSLADFHVWMDSLSAPHLFRLHADSLRRRTPWFGHAPGARIEFWDDDGAGVWRDGDSTVVRLRRRQPDEARRHPERIVIPRGERLRFEQRGDGVLVVPDGKGGTWIYVPPKEE